MTLPPPPPSLEVDHLVFEGGVEDLKKKSCKAFTVKKYIYHAAKWLKKCIHSPKKIACTTGQ